MIRRARSQCLGHVRRESPEPLSPGTTRTSTRQKRSTQGRERGADLDGQHAWAVSVTLRRSSAASFCQRRHYSSVRCPKGRPRPHRPPDEVALAHKPCLIRSAKLTTTPSRMKPHKAVGPM